MDDKNGTPGDTSNGPKPKGKLFHLYKSLYADNAAFVFLNGDNLITGVKTIQEAFNTFGLKVHVGKKATETKKKSKSKTITVADAPWDGKKAPAKT